MSIKVRRLAIANRGEIAVRIIRACRELGLETVQLYSEADENSLAVRMADRSVCIGGPRATDTYLNARALIEAARACKADAIHPGYGFLSENAEFAQLCQRHEIIWVGPPPEVIRLMGDKAVARKAAAAVDVPTVPGSDGVVRGWEEAATIAERIGYPLLLKASSGGGGRGMRIVTSAGALAGAFTEAQSEAKAAFGDESLYIERFLARVRHIEVQVLGDRGTVIQLGERDCSTQRRNQKLVEESPAPISEDLRARLTQAALHIARSVGYISAGTIEFIVDESADSFYFMEMNTRIQVEHPVTEMVTGVDLVKAQIQIAIGEGLGLSQSDFTTTGHSIECRINAEDPQRGFAPCPGTITAFIVPGGPGVRIDTHVYAGYTVPPYYDSLIAKLLVWGRSRSEAVARMQRALGEMRVEGIKTTIPFHQRLLKDRVFRTNEMYTRYIEDEFLR